MPITDKVAAAKQIGEFLQAVISNGGFKLKYRVTVDPPMAQNREWEHPEILVEFAGPDSALLLERSGELLRSFELLASEILRLQGNEHEKIWFDCQNFRAHADRRTATRGAGSGGAGAPDERALPLRPHVVARAPHRASGAARRKRFAHRE